VTSIGAACSSSSASKPNASSGGQSSTTTGGPLRPSGEVNAGNAAAAAKKATLGETVTLDTGLTMKVTHMRIGGDNLGPWLTVAVRAENRSGQSTTNPQVAIYCKGEPEGGGYQADSTYSLSAELPTGSFAEGNVNLLLPKDSRTGVATPLCAEPATVRVNEFQSVTVGNEQPKSFDYAIPPALVAQMNAKRTR
jgi:hypothetical protein